MNEFDRFVLARALHVFAVVLWIGGVAFVTTVLIPALRNMPEKEGRLDLFEQLEGKFSFQAKVTTLLTGVSGYYMLEVLNGWDRYLHIQFWWMHLMTVVWGIFTVVLFVLEPLFLHKWFHHKAQKDSEKAFFMLHLMHKVLLTLSLIAVVGAVAGSHGYAFTL